MEMEWYMTQIEAMWKIKLERKWNEEKALKKNSKTVITVEIPIKHTSCPTQFKINSDECGERNSNIDSLLRMMMMMMIRTVTNSARTGVPFLIMSFHSIQYCRCAVSIPLLFDINNNGR